MKKKIIIGIIVAIVAVILIGEITIQMYDEIEYKNESSGNEVSNVDEPKKVDSNTDFELSFLKMENKNKNMIYSPLSIKYALAMLNEGAKGETKSQIEKVISTLEFPTYKSIGENLLFANGLFIRDNYFDTVKESYINILKSKYSAEVESDKFEDAGNVNNWIENKTLGIIQNMLDDSIVQNPNLKMVLINALAIDMEWDRSFSCNDTYGTDFYQEDGTKLEATTMHYKTSDQNTLYRADNDIIAISKDLKQYDDMQLEFIAIMPQNEKLTEYVDHITMDDINEVIDSMEPASNAKAGINIAIPKFKYNYDLDLKNDLMSLGITEAFDEEDANFEDMSNEELYVSDALHKADIEFSEKGIKAAAVTVMTMMAKSAMMRDVPIDVTFDKPFLYLIRDKANGEVWFIGTMQKPNLWENDKSEYEPSDLVY